MNLRLSPKRFFLIMSALLIILLGSIFGAAVGGNILLKKQSDKLTQLKVNHKALEHQQVLLVQAKKDIEKYRELDSIVKAIVPQDKDQAKTVREIAAIAAQNSIPIKSIDFDTSTLGDKSSKTTQPAGEGQGASKAPPAAISQVKPVAGIPGVYTLEVRVSGAREVTYQNLLGFLEGLENNRRTAHVIKIDLDPTADGQAIKFSLTLNAYIKP